MMDPAVEIPQGDDSVPDTVCVDAKSLECSQTPADPVSKVLDDDNLLIEIIVRLGYPTTLVHAALVCKRWFRHASDSAFLIRFRKLHPPRILGFYIDNEVFSSRSCFVSMLPHPPEFDTVICRASFSLDTCSNPHKFIMGCWNGNVFVHSFKNNDEGPGTINLVLSPLCPERGMAILPRFPWHQSRDGIICWLGQLLFKEGASLSYMFAVFESNKEKTQTMVKVYSLQDGVWCMNKSAMIELHFQRVLDPLLVDNKIYIPANPSSIIVLDLTDLSFSTLKLPQGVAEYGLRDTVMSRADDDGGLYLINAKEFQLGIWLYKRDKWLLVDTICLRQLFANLRISDHTFEDERFEYFYINKAGSNAEFVFLQKGPYVLYLDIKCRTLRNVWNTGLGRLHEIHPFMMIWPPTFPKLKDDIARDAT